MMGNASPAAGVWSYGAGGRGSPGVGGYRYVVWTPAEWNRGGRGDPAERDLAGHREEEPWRTSALCGGDRGACAG